MSLAKRDPLHLASLCVSFHTNDKPSAVAAAVRYGKWQLCSSSGAVAAVAAAVHCPCAPVCLMHNCLLLQCRIAKQNLGADSLNHKVFLHEN